MKLLNNDEFLDHLNKMYEISRTSGTVFVTMKRLLPKQSSATSDVNMTSNLEEDNEYQCLVRAVLKKHKISTLVQSSDSVRFQGAYMNVLRTNLTALKKKDRTKDKERKKMKKTKPTA
ncbi:uncharacterized protein VTP21DRAFT_2035 [Calcarisporiella thermophila]|uniref:uncharacterized protein n=1 Tax=Calcarisporiella thermophila TaxID=911321 RepID=UPI003742061B